jgi:DNA-binding GntR family transcriptional regulator
MQMVSGADRSSVDGGGAQGIAYGDRAKAVYDWVLARILTAELEPGCFLDKQAIADAVGVSRQPVTVALSRLAREGWVEIENRVGSYVARINPKSLREIVFLWFAFNSLVLRELMSNPAEGLERDIRRLRAEYAALRDAGVSDLEVARHGELAFETLVKSHTHQKAGAYYDMFRLHFRRFLAFAARVPGLEGAVGEYVTFAADAWMRALDVLASRDVGAISSFNEKLEQACFALLDRFEALQEKT